MISRCYKKLNTFCECLIVNSVRAVRGLGFSAQWHNRKVSGLQGESGKSSAEMERLCVALIDAVPKVGFASLILL